MRTHTSQPLSRDDRGFRTDALQLRNQLQGWTVEVEQERISVFSPGRNHFFGRWQQVGFQPIESFEIMFFFRTSSITSEKLSRARTLSQTQQPDIQDVNPRWTLIPRLFHCGDYNISSKVIRFFLGVVPTSRGWTLNNIEHLSRVHICSIICMMCYPNPQVMGPEVHAEGRELTSDGPMGQFSVGFRRFHVWQHPERTRYPLVI